MKTTKITEKTICSEKQLRKYNKQYEESFRYLNNKKQKALENNNSKALEEISWRFSNLDSEYFERTGKHYSQQTAHEPIKKTKKGYWSFLWNLTKGYRGKYVTFTVFIIVSIFFRTINIFFSKLLIDAIPTSGQALPDIFDPNKTGIIGSWIVNILGGPEHLVNNLWIFPVIILCLAVVDVILTFFRITIRGRLSHSITKKLQMMLFTQIERIPFQSLKKFQSGDVIQTCTRDLQLIRRTVSMHYSSLVWTLSTIVFSFTILCTISWQMALISVASLPILFGYTLLLMKRITKLSRIWDDSEGQLLSKIEENLASVRTVKVYNNEQHEIRDFDVYVKDHRKKYINLRLFSGMYAATSDVFVIGQIAFATIMAGVFALLGYISVSTFVLVFTYVNMIVWPTRELAQIFSTLAQTFSSIDRINLIMGEPIEDIVTGVRTPIKGSIECKDLCFHFEDANTDALHNINLSIKAGETVAIVGKTGSGKSTFVHILSALFDYSSGSIKIDGIELRDYAKEYLRQNVASVLQDPYLFSRTVISNLKLVNDKVSSTEVDSAIDTANLQKTISELPKGFDTEIGEKGATLSGGQRQRLAIARGLLQNAPINIFDDSLSALDTQTDFEVRQKLRSQRAGSTTIIVTHRMQTAKDADKIIVFNEGKIEAVGTHDELMKIEGIYKRIYEIQTGLFYKELSK